MSKWIQYIVEIGVNLVCVAANLENVLADFFE